MTKAPVAETISTGKISFWQTFLTALISIASTLVLGGVFLGGTFQRLTEAETKVAETRQKQEELNKEMNIKRDDIQHRMVEKDDFKELRKDFQDFARKK